MSGTYTPTGAAYGGAITIPGDGDNKPADSVDVALKGLAEMIEYVRRHSQPLVFSRTDGSVGSPHSETIAADDAWHQPANLYFNASADLAAWAPAVGDVVEVTFEFQLRVDAPTANGEVGHVELSWYEGALPFNDETGSYRKIFVGDMTDTNQPSVPFSLTLLHKMVAAADFYATPRIYGISADCAHIYVEGAISTRVRIFKAVP